MLQKVTGHLEGRDVSVVAEEEDDQVCLVLDWNHLDLEDDQVNDDDDFEWHAGHWTFEYMPILDGIFIITMWHGVSSDHLQPDAGGVLVIVEDLVHRRVLSLKTSHQALQHVL